MHTDKSFYKKYHTEFNQILIKDGMSQIEKENMCPLAGTLYETFGAEVEHVLSIGNQTEFKRVWTVIHSDGRSNAWYVVPGFHRVNRIGYIITKEEWVDINDEYKF